jgi:hypothetical protein
VKQINFHRVFAVGGVAALGIVYPLLWIKMITSPAERTGADFIGFYTSARIAQTEGAEWIYEPALQQQVEQEVVGFPLIPEQILLFNHMPYFVPFLTILVNANYVASFIRWTLFLLLFIFIDAGLLLSLTKTLGIDKKSRLILLTGTLLFFPMFTSVMNGQDTVLILFAAILWLTGILSGRYALAGIGLCLTTIRPQIAILLAVPFLFQQRKVWWWFTVGAVVLFISVIVYLGVDGTQRFVNILLVSSRGEWYGLHPEDMPTLTGGLHRIFPNLSGTTIRLVGMIGYALAIGSLCLLWFRSHRIGEREIGLAVLAAMVFTPYLHYHDLSLLLIPLYCVIRTSSLFRKETLVLFPLGISVLFLLGFIVVPIRYPMVLILILGLAVMLWNPDILRRLGSPRHA